MRAPRPSWHLLLAAGLLVGSSSSVLGRLFPLTDWATGSLLGVGLGLEILALRQALRAHKPSC